MIFSTPIGQHYTRGMRKRRVKVVPHSAGGSVYYFQRWVEANRGHGGWRTVRAHHSDSVYGLWLMRLRWVARGRLPWGQHRRTVRLLDVLAFVTVRAIIVGAAVAGVVALVTDIRFWPVFALVGATLLVRGVLRWRKALHGLREHMARRIEHDDDDEAGGEGVREPRRPMGPRPGLRTSADPDESTGPSVIP